MDEESEVLMSETGNDAKDSVSRKPEITPPEWTRRRTSGKAVGAFALGLTSMILWLFAGIPAIFLAIWAKRDIRKNPLLDGRILANLGLALGILSVVASPMLFAAAAMWLINGAHADHADRIAHFHLSGLMVESPRGDPLGTLTGQPNSFADLLARLKHAREDDAVKAVVITVDNPLLAFAQMEELHGELAAFAASGKKLFAHCEEQLMPMRLYIALATATHLSVAPTALIDLRGFYGEAPYLKEGLAKIGVEADIVQIGDYKTAGEMFSRTEPSEAGKEDMNRLLDGLYESCVHMIAEARHKPADEVKRLIDAAPYPVKRALEAGLIDSVAHQDAFLEGIKREYGNTIRIDNDYERIAPPTVDMQRPLRSEWSVARYFFRVQKWLWKDSIGLIYLEGAIVPGFGGPGVAWSGDIRDALKTAAEDDSIKAVVLRVDSPGGSVTASEVILRAAQTLKRKKPLVVSMGSTAASGGYYVSCGANAIFADETTLTGSIGVIGGKLVSTGLWNKLGVNWFAYQRGANADLYSGAHPFDERQRADVTRYMLDAYETFKEHVTSGRGTKLAKGIDELAGGRVFTGKQALELGLVDKIGGLEAAIAYAAELVSLKDYQVQVVPQPKDAAQMLMDTFFGSPRPPSDLDLDARVRQPNIERLQGLVGQPDVAAAARLLEGLDSRHARVALELLRRIQLLGQEGIAMIMPQVFAIE